MFVVGLAYNHDILPQTKKALTASIYTYGLDYHLVFNEIFSHLNLDDHYQGLIDNHDLDENAPELDWTVPRGKNNLMMICSLAVRAFFIGL